MKNKLICVIIFSGLWLTARTQVDTTEYEEIGVFVDESIDDVPEVMMIEVPDANDFIRVEREPVPLNIDEVRTLIGYPQIAVDAGVEGMVIARVLVDKDGNYVRHVIVSRPHPVLSDAVEAKLPRLQFTPAIQDGRPIFFWVIIPLTSIW